MKLVHFVAKNDWIKRIWQQTSSVPPVEIDEDEGTSGYENVEVLEVKEANNARVECEYCQMNMPQEE